MTRSARRFAALLLLAAGLSAQEQPRVIVLGFDGVDHGLAQRFMDEGHLPHLKALAAQGSYSRLETTNPAESAVSWTTFGRGLNPGNTSMFGFVSRKDGTYFPEVRFVKQGESPLLEHYDGPPAMWPVTLGCAAVGLVLGMLLAGLLGGGAVLRVGAAVVVGGAAGVGGWMLMRGSVADAEVTTLQPVADGKQVYHRLDEAGVRVKGFLVPMSTPIEPLDAGQMNGGLGVPDVAGNPNGTFFLLTTSDKDVPVGDSRRTSSQGHVIKLAERDGSWRAQLLGPEVEVEAEDGAEPETEPSTLGVVVRRAGEGRVAVTVGGQTMEAAEGEWSDFLAVRFPVDWPRPAAALARFRVVSAGDDIRLFFPSLGLDPREIPEHLGVEYPPGFSKRVAEDAGLYDTTGWACVTNPLKDIEIDEEVFLEQIRLLTEDRARVVYSELAKDDWDFFFAMFGETDRIQHMMFRLFDEQHPLYDAELAQKYGSAILDVYQAMDGIVGEVMDRFVGDGTHLMVVSDHGFTSFRRQMALNSWLIQEGYLVPKRGGRDTEALARRLRRNDDYLMYMDRARSKAFALGLGKIYINLEGREASGIVEADEYDALCAEITEKLLAYRDPGTGDQVVQKVWRAADLYNGPYAGTDADLYLGFAPYYRVSWSTTTGGFSAQVMEDNDSKWSGGHASNDPDVVPGVLFSSRALAPGQRPAIVDMAPTLCALFGVETGGMDGRALAFQ